MPAVLPGTCHFSADITVNKHISHLYVDEEVDEKIRQYVFVFPCVGDGIGTWSVKVFSL